MLYSYVISEMQIKTTVSYPFMPIRVTKTQNTDTTKCGEDEEQQELSFTVDGNAKWYSHSGIQFSIFLQN